MRTRRPSHPINCDCALCVTGYVRGLSTVPSCEKCAMANKCDGHLRTTALTDQLVKTEYLEPDDRTLVGVMARACRKFATKEAK